MQELWGHGSLHSDLKGRPGRPSKVYLKGQCTQLWEYSEGAVETSGIWRSQKCGVSTKKTSCSEWSQPKRKVTWAATSKAMGAGLSKPSEVHIWSQVGLGSCHTATGFNACTVGFWSCFGLWLPFVMKMFTLYHLLYAASVLTFFLIFTGAHSQPFVLDFKGDFRFKIFCNVRSVKSLVTFKDTVIAFCKMRWTWLSLLRGRAEC